MKKAFFLILLSFSIVVCTACGNTDDKSSSKSKRLKPCKLWLGYDKLKEI